MEWTDENIEKLKKLVLEDNLSASSIADGFGVSSSTIIRAIKKFNIVRTQRPKSKNIKHHRRDEEIIKAVRENTSIGGILTDLGLKNVGGYVTWIKKKIIELGLDTSHITGRPKNPGKIPNHKYELKDILVENSTYSDNNKLRARLINEKVKEAKCECCGLDTWNGKPIPLQLHHINGNHFDNRLENLQILCPNCHSQTDNYCSKNKINPVNKNTIEMPTKEDLLKLIKETKSSRELSNNLGVSETTIRKWIKTLNIRDEVDKIRNEKRKEARD